MKDLFKYLSLAVGGAIALKQLGIYDVSKLWQSLKPSGATGWTEQPPPAGSTDGGSLPRGTTGTGSPAGGGSTGGFTTLPAAVDPNAGQIIALVGKGVSEALATQWVKKYMSADQLATLAAGGKADAIALADAIGFKLTPDQWNFYRNVAGKGQVTVDLVDAAVRGTTFVGASQYQQMLSAVGLAGLALFAATRPRYRGVED